MYLKNSQTKLVKLSLLSIFVKIRICRFGIWLLAPVSKITINNREVKSSIHLVYSSTSTMQRLEISKQTNAKPDESNLRVTT